MMNAGDFSPQLLKDLGLNTTNDLSSLDSEGERLWNTLNELSTNPEAYQEFMLRQQHSSTYPPFVPHAGFVVKAFLKSDGAKLFVNVCGHDIVGKTLDDTQIPLLISKMRKLIDGSNDGTLVIDAVVHPFCIKSCEDQTFKTQLIELIVQSIQIDYGIEVSTPWKALKSSYKGGAGTGATPLPFEGQEQLKPKNSHFKSPEDLLKSKVNETSGADSKHDDIKLPGVDKIQPTGKLIQEVGSKSEKPSGFKSGFLSKPANSKKKAGAKSKPSTSSSETNDVDKTCPTEDTKSVAGSTSAQAKEITLSASEKTVSVHVDFSSCHPAISSMDDLELLVSTKSLVLKATKCAKQWEVEFPSSVDVSSVRAKLTKKTQTLVIECAKK